MTFVHKAEGPGYTNGMKVILDANSLKPRYKHSRTYKNTFKLSIQHPNDFPLPLLEGIELEGGYKISVVVSPKVLESSKNVKNLEVHRRECKFEDESSDLKLFKQYNHKSCHFDCMWQTAYEHCHCIPWMYPNPGTPVEICDTTGNFCWKSMNITRKFSSNQPKFVQEQPTKNALFTQNCQENCPWAKTLAIMTKNLFFMGYL